MARASFKEQVLQAREDAIVLAANRLLAGKGFEAMTVDEVAADVGISKASLYKHFKSKEELAAAAMVRLLDRALDRIEALRADAQAPALQQLHAVTRWMLQVQLVGEMPSLPAQNSALRAVLTKHPGYMDRLVKVSDQLGAWIVAAQSSGELAPQWPAELVLYTLYARACDPVLQVMRATGRYGDDEIIELLLGTCFSGLLRR